MAPLKGLATPIAHFLRQEATRGNLKALGRLLLLLLVMVAVYSLIFHVLMLREGREYSWFTGVYWTLTVMSTLGFGDVTFTTDLGRVFSMMVLMTGTIYMLILLPFSFIRFFYTPWMEAQAEARALRDVPENISGHVVMTHYDAVTATLIRKLDEYHYPYFLLVPSLGEAMRLHDKGLNVVVGELDNPKAYRRVRVEQAAMVATTASDPVNTHVAFTVRGLAENVPIAAVADDPASADILELSGCSYVLQIAEMLGQSLARRTHGSDGRAHLVGSYGDLQIAETTVTGTPMVGRTLEEGGLRRELKLNVVGVWDRGVFETARPATVVRESTVLVMAGTKEQLEQFDERYRIFRVTEAPTTIIGGGRVGRAAARTLAERGLSYRIVEQNPEVVGESEEFVTGNAAELEVLKVVWRRGPSTVHEVQAALEASKRKWAYTTLLTLLRRLAEKGYLIAAKQGRAHVYEAAIQQHELLREHLTDLADRVCEGQSLPLMLSLFEGRQFSNEEIGHFRQLLDQLDTGVPKSPKKRSTKEE